jgi:hypothetical protein
VPAELQGGLAMEAWWTRIRRAAEREGLIGSKVMSDWCRARLAVIGDAAEGVELVGPPGHRRWQPVPPERCSEEYLRREARRLNDELGRALGVGPMP